MKRSFKKIAVFRGGGYGRISPWRMHICAMLTNMLGNSEATDGGSLFGDFLAMTRSHSHE